MRTLILQRYKESVNQNFKYDILLDGRKVDRLANGEMKELHIEGENHELEVKMMWCGSKKIKLTSEIGDLNIKGNVFLNRVMPFLTVSIIIFMTSLHQLFLSKVFSIVVISCAMMGLIHSLTYWRNNWISINSKTPETLD